MPVCSGCHTGLGQVVLKLSRRAAGLAGSREGIAAMRIGFAGKWLGLWVAVLLSWSACSPVVAQTVPTTTVQGTVYLANGQPGSGTVLVSWPAFTTAANQQVAAGSTTVTVGADGFLSVNLAANLGSNPAGLYYTAVFQLGDGTVNTQYCGADAAGARFADFGAGGDAGADAVGV